MVSFHAMQETLERTTLHQLTKGDQVNVERSATYGAEIGGHPLSGHIDGRATVTSVETPENNFKITFNVEKPLVPYLFEKGYVGIHGASLTIASLEEDTGRFTVWLIPETLRRTNLGTLSVGDEVNLEIDRQTQVIVDTISRCLQRELVSK